MNIWVIAVGEPSSLDEGHRLHRSGLLAKNLSEKGHSVTLFNSTFFHQKKINRFSNTTIMDLNGLKLVLLYGNTYKRNISINRLISNYLNKINLRKVIKTLDLPDLIIVSFPILGLVTEIRKFSSKFKIPYIVDVRDFWPEVFYSLIPKKLLIVAKLLFVPFESSLRKNLNEAQAIISPFKSGINWSKSRLTSDQCNTKFFSSIPFTYPEPSNNDDITEPIGFENDIKGKIVIVAVGNISLIANLDLLVSIAKKLQNKDFHFLVCGDGDYLPQLKRRAKGLENINFLGWLNQTQLKYVLGKSHLGFLGYKNEALKQGVPNKFSEYLSFSLPILTCQEGNVENLVKDNNLGIFFDENNLDKLCIDLEDLLNTRSTLEDMTINSRFLYEKEFSENSVYSRFDDLIEKVSKKNKK